MTVQLPLFDAYSSPSIDGQAVTEDELQREEKIKNISWSYSRRSSMEKCLRSYYYEYFGANKRTAKQEINKNEIWRLKQLKNRHLRAGEILHLLISSYFRKSKEGILWDSDRLVNWASDLFKKDITYSQSIKGDWELSKEKYPPAILAEFYFKDPTALEKCLFVENRLITAIKSFMTNSLYSEFRQKGSQDSSIIEGFIKLHSVTPCKIDGRIDLAYKEDSKVTVVDWKLGNEDGIGDDSLQLAAYGLWAVETLNCHPESVKISKVHFSSEKIVNFDCNSQVLSAARIRIMQDAERMAFLEGYGNKACIEAFTPCTQAAICRQCSYVVICKEGREVIYA